MARETAEILEDIATQLRQYVERTGEMAKRTEERFLTRVAPPMFDIKRDIEETQQKHAAAAEKHRAEERAFRERLLSLLERHNEMLARVLESPRKASPKRTRARSRRGK